ncbi:ABC transporter substrate-binding protein [Undibacter mobilis]|uniref:ABC transporter substrate-binding protein n=2 Tax=Undibacter mobilis TaxID=2292256 RepID=A0A371B6N9_9BRAD|nr:ABC transporter substrate-binding protein [Undibacter mobilis]
MKVQLLHGLLGAAMTVAVASGASARDLTVVSWGGAVQKAQSVAAFEPFAASSKVPLKETSWEGGIGIIRAKVQGGNADWDVVEVESDELALGCEENLYEKLDWSKIGGKDIYFPEAVHDCGVGALLYSFVLAYDPQKLSTPPKSWTDFYDLQKYPGKRGLRSGPKLTLETALMADGVAPKDVYKVLGTEEGVNRAFKKLDTIKSSIIWWQTGQKPVELLASGEVAMTGVFNGRITAAKKAGKAFAMSWNQSMFTWDSWVILKGSPNKDAAYKLLAFMADASRQAHQMTMLANGTSTKQSIAMTPKDIAADLPSAPDNSAHAFEVSATFWLDNFDKLSDRFTKWVAQ